MSDVGDSLPNCQQLYKMALIKRIRRSSINKYLIDTPYRMTPPALSARSISLGSKVPIKQMLGEVMKIFSFAQSFSG
jgi:hypothetical protein